MALSSGAIGPTEKFAHLLTAVVHKQVAVGHPQDRFVAALGADDVVKTTVNLLAVVLERHLTGGLQIFS